MMSCLLSCSKDFSLPFFSFFVKIALTLTWDTPLLISDQFTGSAESSHPSYVTFPSTLFLLFPYSGYCSPWRDKNCFNYQMMNILSKIPKCMSSWCISWILIHVHASRYSKVNGGTIVIIWIILYFHFHDWVLTFFVLMHLISKFPVASLFFASLSLILYWPAWCLAYDKCLIYAPWNAQNKE